MNLSRFFIDRPIFAGVISVLIFLAGAISVFQLPISEYPEVVPPTVVVKAQFPVANPKVIAETVASPLEEQINGTENMLYMFSQASSDGLLTLTVTFKLGTDPNLAQELVQNRVNQALPRLPDVTRSLGVTTIKTSPDLTMAVHLTSPNGRYDMLYLRHDARLNVKDQLAKIQGVGSVQLFGSGDYAMRVWLNPQKIASFAFIMGVVPLVVSVGAGAEMRHAMGVAVFSGTLGVTFFGLFLTLVFYVLLRGVEKRVARGSVAGGSQSITGGWTSSVLR